MEKRIIVDIHPDSAWKHCKDSIIGEIIYPVKSGLNPIKSNPEFCEGYFIFEDEKFNDSDIGWCYAFGLKTEPVQSKVDKYDPRKEGFRRSLYSRKIKWKPRT
jgi:hypothetical protein